MSRQWEPEPIGTITVFRQTDIIGQHGNNPRGEDHYAAKLTEQNVRDIRAGKFKSGLAAARELGVHHQTIYRIMRGEMWAHV